jgi:hypothetical protein
MLAQAGINLLGRLDAVVETASSTPPKSPTSTARRRFFVRAGRMGEPGTMALSRTCMFETVTPPVRVASCSFFSSIS